MKRFLIPLALCLSTVPAVAQEEDGFSLMDEGARLFLRGLMSEIEPTLDDLEGFARDLEPGLRDLAEQMGPALAGLMARIDDLSHYEAPVLLDNGDILIRRRADAPPYDPAPDPADPDAPGTEEITGPIDL